MTVQTAETGPSAVRLLKSAGALLAGFIVVVVLSIGTDQIFHSLGVYPPWGEPMHAPGLNLLALAYRCIYAVAGSFVAARLAPNRPMGHALTLGAIGLVLSTAGAIAMWDFGPNWYPVALVLTALPCAWLGGAAHRMSQREG